MATKVLEDVCDQCGKELGVTSSSTLGLLCPRCANDVAIFRASEEHLQGLLADAFGEWLDTWERNPTFQRDRHSLLDTLEKFPPGVALQVLAQRAKPQRRRL